MKSEIHPREDLYANVLAFYNRESRLLDERRFDEWMECLTDDVTYQVPARSSTVGNQSQFGDVRSGYFDDGKATLATRFLLSSKPGAWTENPPARTRRFVSNLQLTQVADGEFEAVVNLLVTSVRDGQMPTVIVGERRDKLGLKDGEFKIKQRAVLVDNGVLTADAMSIPI